MSSTSSGELELNSDGGFRYTPDNNFNGQDSFSYRARDGDAAAGLTSEVVTVDIAVTPVNDPPVPQDDSFTINEDNTLTVTSESGVLANDSDVEGDDLTVTVVNAPARGEFELSDDGSFTYTPEEHFNGEDTFVYRVSDGVDSEVATATITVTPVNDSPVATAESYSTTEDTLLTINAATGVLDNDTDVDGDVLEVVLVSTTQSGTLVMDTADGSFTYTPNANFNGEDTFSYLSLIHI